MPSDSRSSNWFAKRSDPTEYLWTQFLAPELQPKFKDGVLRTRLVPGATLADGVYAADIWARALETLYCLHEKALAPNAPPTPPARPWGSSLRSAWTKIRTSVGRSEQHLLESVRPLLASLHQIPRFGIFLDANPRNWIVSGEILQPLDFGHVVVANPLSDICQLLDNDTCPLDLVQEARAWFHSLRKYAWQPTDTEIATVATFSLLMRAPTLSTAARRSLYSRGRRHARAAGLEKLDECLSSAIEED